MAESCSQTYSIEPSWILEDKDQVIEKYHSRIFGPLL